MFSMLYCTASDNHLGYMESDPIRRNDTLETFKEILTIARDQDVSDWVVYKGVA